MINSRKHLRARQSRVSTYDAAGQASGKFLQASEVAEAEIRSGNQPHAACSGLSSFTVAIHDLDERASLGLIDVLVHLQIFCR